LRKNAGETLISTFGPVFDAAHGGNGESWFSILLGAFFMVALWTKYLKREVRSGTHIGIVLFISTICAMFIVTGIWELLH
jgi:hypothetical protein